MSTKERFQAAVPELNSHEAIAQHLQRDKRGAPLDHLALFDRIDVNGDGVISRSEWCNAFENPASITLSEGELHEGELSEGELSRLDSGTEWSIDGWLASLGLSTALPPPVGNARSLASSPSAEPWPVPPWKSGWSLDRTVPLMSQRWRC